MQRTTRDRGMSSAEKKRLRDRRAQEAMRKRRDQHVRELEDRVAVCEAQHEVTIRELRDALAAQSSVAAAGVYSPPVPEDMGYSDELRLYGSPPSSHSGVEDSIWPCAATGTPGPPNSNVLPVFPAWALCPLNDDYSAISEALRDCIADPARLAMAPVEPLPLDLLYGTRCNPLADAIHSSLRQWFSRDPEVLASGWVMYLYFMWRAQLTNEAYQRLPAFLRPLLQQLQTIHPILCDLIAWPQMRLNLLAKRDGTSTTDVIALMSCCIKVRWPWGEPVLDRGPDNELRIREDFKQVFMSEQGWGVTPEFAERHPELLEGLDLNSIAIDIR